MSARILPKYKQTMNRYQLEVSSSQSQGYLKVRVMKMMKMIALNQQTMFTDQKVEATLDVSVVLV